MSPTNTDRYMATNMPRSDAAAGSSAQSNGSDSGGTGPGQNSSRPAQDNSGTFECNICLDTARDAVVSMCGHLFCWPCLHQWLETRPNRKMCPVCKAGISKDKVIPLYGRGNVNQQDPREKVPPRPQGHRTEPESSSNLSSFGFGDNGFQMSFGIGAFPFSFFASSFNLHDGRPQAPQPGTPQHMEESFLSRIFLAMAIIFIFWLMIA